MALLVLDASFVLKWYKQEVHSEIAVRIKDEFIEGIHEIVVPDLLLYELANAMRFNKDFTEELVKESLVNFIDFDRHHNTYR